VIITLCNTGANAQKGARLKRIEKHVDADQYGDLWGWARRHRY
jgi:hypothetical protein